MQPLMRTLSLAALLSLIANPAFARVNPLRVMTAGVENPRAEVIIVLDTSNSIDDPNGAGCSGEQPADIDICGDGMCTGYEAPTGSGSCSDDCQKTNEYQDPGFKPNCKSPSSTEGSRMFMLKRIMRNLLPEFRTVASFGLITYPKHENPLISGGGYYYTYYQAATGTSKDVTIFLTERELKAGGWVGGLGWDTTNDKPVNSFTTWSTTYTRLDIAAGSSATITDDTDSLYRRADGDGFVDKRYKWNGYQWSDGTYNWEYVGSYYTFSQAPSDTSLVGLATEYYGPQLVTGGITYVYHRYFVSDAGSPWTEVTDTAALFHPLEADDDQDVQDEHFGTLFNHLNAPWSGGMATDHTSQHSPARAAIEMAQQHFKDRKDGTGPFVADGTDVLNDCRRRVVIYLTDGKYNPSTTANDPRPAIGSLYNDYPSDPTNNPIETYTIGMFVQGSNIDTVDDAADWGDDGILNGSVSALTGGNEEELTDALRTTLVNALQGDFTTSAPGVTTISTNQSVTIADNVTLIPSTEFPGWKGKLQAIDVSQDPPQVLWEAGSLLEQRDWATRLIYTGLPGVNSGNPILMMEDDGSGLVNADGTGFGGIGIRDLWPGGSSSAPSDEEITGLVHFIAGRERQWKLGPIVNSVPATVGPPPVYTGLTGHDTFETDYDGRERFSYIEAADGGLHAFRTLSGEEAFMYVPPDVFPKIYELFQQGGQDPDPRNFSFNLTASPRVEDIPVSGGWKTELVMPMGPGGEAFVVLDVTAPSDCSTCGLNDPPFTILSHSDDLGMAPYLGESWSEPAIYYNWILGAPVAHLSVGAGYPGSGTNDHYYHTRVDDFWNSITAGTDTYTLSPSSPRVDYGILSNTSAVIDFDSYRQVVATYQADVNGRITRFTKGDPTTALSLTVGTDLPDNDHPFYYAPAVYHTGSNVVTLAHASGSFYEEGSWMSDASYTSKIFFLQEQNGTIGDNVVCEIDQICTCVPSTGCTGAPSAAAVPNGQPLLVQNANAGNAMEAFFLYYDPPPTTPGSCGVLVGGQLGDPSAL